MIDTRFYPDVLLWGAVALVLFIIYIALEDAP